jgi:hypothetical protein
VPLRHARPAADHEPGGGLLLDRNLERGAGEGERAADRQRFFALRAVVRSWGPSEAVLLDPSLSGFDPNGHCGRSRPDSIARVMLFFFRRFYRLSEFELSIAVQ